MKDETHSRPMLVGALAAMMSVPGPGIAQPRPVAVTPEPFSPEEQATFDQERIAKAGNKRARRKAKRQRSA